MADKTASIRYVEDKNGDVFFPVTHQRGVVDSDGTNLETTLASKQDTLVSGTSIKTINGSSILGSGNIEVQTEITMDDTPTSGSNNPVKSGGLYTELAEKIGSQDIDNVVELTLAQYNALATKDARTMYIISDSTIASDHVGVASLVQTTTSTEDGGTNVWTCTLTNGETSSFEVKNGNQGNSGYSGAAGELEVVNNVTQGGATAALSAEMGKQLEGEISQLGLRVSDIKLLLRGSFRAALVAALQHVAFIDEYGQAYITAIDNALSSITTDVVSISAVYTQGGTVWENTALDTLKDDLVVTGTLEDSSQVVISASEYTLSGTLTEGTSVITVIYGALQTTFNVTVSHGQLLTMTGGDITALDGSISWDTTKDLCWSQSGSATSTRRGGVSAHDVGVKKINHTTNGSTVDYVSDYYPIPIPSWATRVIISATNAGGNIQTGPGFYTFANDAYTRELDPGWDSGERSFDFTAGQYGYLTVAMKLSSGNISSNPPTEVTVMFY